MFITLLFIIIYYLVRVQCAGLGAIASTALPGHSNKDVKLVNWLQQGLRRNNDDYAERPLNTEASRNHSVNTTEANRRAIDSSDEVEYNKYSFRPAASNPPASLPSLYPSSAATASPKYVNKDKADKVKKFLEKNQDLLQHFFDRKRAESQTEAMRARNLDSTGEESEAEGKGWDHRVPGPRELDMAPAKGGHIHSLRIRGRLCQRSVLMPEGPKYNSRGAVYLAAYRGAGDYTQTKAPRLVLPHCCNCCDKSVLGCE